MSDDLQTPRPEPSAIPQGQVTIVLESAGIGPPTACRVRRLLKAALRSYGLRCIRCDLPKDAPATAGLTPQQTADAFKLLFPRAFKAQEGGEK